MSIHDIHSEDDSLAMQIKLVHELQWTRVSMPNRSYIVLIRLSQFVESKESV